MAMQSVQAMHQLGACVCDRNGRIIPCVLRFDAETGEVIGVTLHWRMKAWDLLNRITKGRFTGEGADWILPSGAITGRHGFWPAPLTVVPNEPPTAQP